jgi:predicted aspartyl protease
MEMQDDLRYCALSIDMFLGKEQRMTSFTLDTGAGINAINEEFAKQLKIPRKRCTKTLKMGNGSIYTAQWKTSLFISPSGKKSKTLEFVVIKDLPVQILIGTSGLKKLDAVINFKEEMVEFGGCHNQFACIFTEEYLPTSKSRMLLHANEDIVLEPLTYSYIPVHVGKEDKAFLSSVQRLYDMESLNKFQPHL